MLEYIDINGKVYDFEPFTTEITSTELYDFLFLEDENEIYKEWVLLNLLMTLENGSTIRINKVAETIEITLSEGDFLQNEIRKLSI